MDLYIYIAIFSYLLFALSGVADKFLLTKAVRSPVVYAFYTGVMAPLVFVLAPFGLELLSPLHLIIAILAGTSFTVAILYFYRAIQQTSISRILPMQGGLVPVFTLILAFVLLRERLSHDQLLGFVFLVLGAVLVSVKKGKGGWKVNAWASGAMAAFYFALYFVLTKYTYGQTNFVSGLIWTRLGFFLSSMAMLLLPSNRKAIFGAPKSTSSGNKLLFYSSKLASSIASFLQNYAVSLGSVSIVNALQGTQFAFLLGLTAVFSKWHPKILKEQFTASIVLQKMLAIVLITVGLFLL